MVQLRNQLFQFLFKKNNQIVLLICLWIIVQLFLYLQLGIRPVLESQKYIRTADRLLAGEGLKEIRYIFYFSTVLVITFCKKIGLGYAGVVLTQLAMNLAALLSFHKAIYERQQNQLSSFILPGILILFIPYQSWNFYLYTESLFYSFVLLFFSSCIKANYLTKTKVFVQFVFLTLTVISRPLGILLLPCWLVYLFLRSDRRKKIALFSFTAISGIVLILVSNTILGNIRDWQVLKPAEYSFIICEMPTSEKLPLDSIKQGSPLVQLLKYIQSYPVHFLSLAYKRLIAFFLLHRSYYSPLHNASLIFYDFLLYTPILLNLFGKQISSYLFYFSLSVILFFTLAVCLQCDDYHNRFHNSIIPIFLFFGLYRYLEGIQQKKKFVL